MPQLPGPSPEWIPLSGSQFLDVGVSTALTIPPIPTSGNPPRPVPGSRLVVILFAQLADQFYRTDGQAVSGNVGAGILLAAGNWVIIYGQQAIQNIRVIHSAGGGSLAVSYYFYRE